MSTNKTYRITEEEIKDLPIKCASLVEYTDDTLTIYSAGKREMNEEEKLIMSDWEKIASTKEYIERSNIDALTDESSTYYQEKRFFENSTCPYLFGTEIKQGKKRDYSTGLIIDNKVKGDIELQYKIYRN